MYPRIRKIAGETPSSMGIFFYFAFEKVLSPAFKLSNFAHNAAILINAFNDDSILSK